MRTEIRFIGNDGSKPKTILAEAEIVFIEPGSPLHGTKLVGFSIRRADTGGVYVTLPGRAFGMGDERRYFDFLRPVSDHHETARSTMIGIKVWMKNAWKRWCREAEIREGAR